MNYKILMAISGIALAGMAEAAPNVVVFMADDFGSGCINAYGAPAALVQTPHLNRLAESGMRFTNANTPASICSPTRYALLTGRYAWRGPLPFGVVNVFDPLIVETDRMTLPKYLKGMGYATAQIGKWHLGYGDKRPADFTEKLTPGPNDLGFDYHFGLPQNLDDIHRVWVENDGVYGLRSKKTSAYAKAFYGKPYIGYDAPQRNREEASEFLTEKAVQWLEKQEKDKPFFLYFASPATHHPIVPSERMRGKSNCGAYGDFIQDLDWSFGQLVQTLEKMGVMDNTIILFTADNGSDIPPDKTRPEQQAIEAGLALNSIYRGDKHTIYEGGGRVPLMVRWDGKVKSGTVSDHMVSIADIFATVADMANGRIVSISDAEDSSSFALTLLGKKQAARNPMVGTNAAGIQSIRSGDWKYTDGVFPDAAPDQLRKAFRKEAVPALYDLEKDPSEENNVIDEYPETVQQMQTVLDSYRSGKGSGSQASRSLGSATTHR
ncbi:sulfatase-like hydrolase/transferase [Pontiella sulfatireligans]|uniref:Arylsulfatase n=1 Tax=Pontiella sulfatireligans TaxID=2750658 RepID=A0A6C2UT89_9BACT|nr:sulfatase-like hydrolase/transferase [Pontiella sulfatireligans]SPS74585.1 sulfatase S1_15 [Kiritimatiellales bacterium]VGO23535.1 Arylsulfatase [Pontiella sulfatireligans]